MNTYYLPKSAFSESEISCLEMIMSCIVYGTDFLTSKWAKGSIQSVGLERATEMWTNQTNYFNMYFEIVTSIYTDSEGLSYNSTKEKIIK